MVLCRPFLVEMEFGNVVFERMVDEMIRSTKKKPQGSIEGSAPKLNFLWRLTSVLPLCSPGKAEPCGGGRGWADLAFPPPPTISKKTDRQIACSRLQHSAEKSDAKNARGLERVGYRSRASYFPLACQSHFRDVPTICKLTDRQTLFQHGVSSTFFFGLTKRSVSATSFTSSSRPKCYR